MTKNSNELFSDNNDYNILTVYCDFVKFELQQVKLDMIFNITNFA